MNAAVYQRGPNLLVRFIWWLFIGWWTSGIAVTIAWLALITIVGIPLGIWIINRLPSILTLRPRTRAWTLGQDEIGQRGRRGPCSAPKSHGRYVASGSCSSAGGYRACGWRSPGSSS